ncbi:MAG: prolipoprotein diacylglyceryl transferase [Pseudomonadota bacterium]|nr:prolipoprotein diacylglyceryl transferase [Pseudomonadota bacterium]
MHYPQIDPIIVSLGPVALRWYGLMYLLGFAAVWWLGHKRAATQHPHWSDNELSDLVFYGAVGAVLGGRIGYVLFYNVSALATDPLYLLRIWEGGMAFHGGLLGVLVAMLLFARKTHRSFISITDFLAPLCPIGLGLGRLGNFINMELPGRVSESGFGLVYPCEVVYAISPMCVGTWESAVRHPSPLYQAFFEGAVLFILLWLVSRKQRPAGLVSALFLCGYGGFRLLTELYREPDAHIGFVLFGGVSMGQLLSLPLLIAGILLGLWSLQNARKAAA